MATRKKPQEKPKQNARGPRSRRPRADHRRRVTITATSPSRPSSSSAVTLRVGDVIHICEHTTDFRQKVESLEVDHTPTTEVGPKDDFGLKVIDHAREHDVVFKVRS